MTIQEQKLRELWQIVPDWKKEALLLELWKRATDEDRQFALDYLEGKKGLFDSFFTAKTQ